MEPGIYTDLSSGACHAAPGISKSGLDRMARSPAHYQAYLREPRVVTPAMRAGTALHTAILEPGLFGSQYAVSPKFDRRTTKGKADAAAFEAENAGKEPVSEDEYENWMRCAEAVRTHPACAFLFQKGHAERSVFANDPVTGEMVKCRPDWEAKVGEMTVNVDIKSTDDARVSAFSRSAFNYGYPMQSAFYSDVCEWAGLPKPDSWFFIAFEKEPPYGIVVFEPDQDFIEYGRTQYRRALDLYHHCKELNEWPAYQTEVQKLSLPSWAS